MYKRPSFISILTIIALSKKERWTDLHKQIIQKEIENKTEVKDIEIKFGENI